MPTKKNATLSHNTPFVVFGDDWGRYPSTLQHVFRHIATRHPVVWVNGIGHRVPSLSGTDVKRALEKGLRLVQGNRTAAAPPGLHLGGQAPAVVIEPRVLPWHHVDLVHRFNTWSLIRSIRRALRSIGANGRPVLVTGSPPSVGVVGKLDELASVYYCLDDFLNFPTYTAAMLAPLERRLLSRVDAVVATAASLTQSKRPHSGRAFHLPQGVNYTHFAEPREIPVDLARISAPRIGFAGTISTQCDVALIRRIADELPHAAVVLVGPERLPAELGKLLDSPNIFRLGTRSYDVLPSYVQHFDVGIVPYVISGWTIAVDPLKMLEYLAAGIRVVSTEIPEADRYRGPVRVCGSANAFVEEVKSALTGGRGDATVRQSFAKSHTWESRATQFLSIVAQLSRDSLDSEAESRASAGRLT